MASKSRQDRRADEDLRRIVEGNVEAIAELRASSNRALTRQERKLSTMVHDLGSPAALFVVLAAIALWLGINLVLLALGHRPFDPPPFAGLQTTMACAAMITSLVVLIGQNRQGRIREHRAELELQLDILVEQRTAKLVQLLEELRRDLPGISEHSEREIRALARSADSKAIIEAIEEALSRADRESGVRGFFEQGSYEEERADDASDR